MVSEPGILRNYSWFRAQRSLPVVLIRPYVILEWILGCQWIGQPSVIILITENLWLNLEIWNAMKLWILNVLSVKNTKTLYALLSILKKSIDFKLESFWILIYKYEAEIMFVLDIPYIHNIISLVTWYIYI